VNFLDAYDARTKSEDAGGLLGDLMWRTEGGTADPAAWADWLENVGKARMSENPRSIRKQKPALMRRGSQAGKAVIGLILVGGGLGLMAYWAKGKLNAADAKGAFMLAALALLGGGQALFSALGLPFGASGGSTDSGFADMFSISDGDSGD
jgi:hypothetical protein